MLESRHGNGYGGFRVMILIIELYSSLYVLSIALTDVGGVGINCYGVWHLSGVLGLLLTRDTPESAQDMVS